jgi:hypothetical protein
MNGKDETVGWEVGEGDWEGYAPVVCGTGPMGKRRSPHSEQVACFSFFETVFILLFSEREKEKRKRKNMATAADRKKAKEQYLLSLQQAKESSYEDKEPSVSEIGFEPQSAGSSSNNAASKREQILADKRKAFFESKTKESKNEPQQQFPNPFQYEKPPNFNENSVPARNNLFEPAHIPPLASISNPPVKNDNNENARLDDWKKLGFPSEYAYAKQLGLLNEKPKPRPMEEISSASQPKKEYQPLQPSVPSLNNANPVIDFLFLCYFRFRIFKHFIFVEELSILCGTACSWIRSL